jgi:hypothetical protein
MTSIFFCKWKTTSFFPEMKDNHNFRKWKTTSIFQEIEDVLNFPGNRSRPQFFRKWKMTKVFRKWKTTQFNISSYQISYFYWLMLILNFQSKPICNSTNFKLDLSLAQPQLVYICNVVIYFKLILGYRQTLNHFLIDLPK